MDLGLLFDCKMKTQRARRDFEQVGDRNMPAVAQPILPDQVVRASPTILDVE